MVLVGWVRVEADPYLTGKPRSMYGITPNSAHTRICCTSSTNDLVKLDQCFALLTCQSLTVSVGGCVTMYDLLEHIIQRIDPVRSTEALSCIYARHSQREIFHICTEHTRTLAASVQVDQWANFSQHKINKKRK